jgi:hypothetical protein
MKCGGHCKGLAGQLLRVEGGGQASEPALVQAFIAKAPVEEFDVRVPVRHPGVDQLQQDLVAAGPVEHRFPRGLPAVIGAHYDRFTGRVIDDREALDESRG